MQRLPQGDPDREHDHEHEAEHDLVPSRTAPGAASPGHATAVPRRSR